MLGGGLSYMSAQYGWAASSALEYEVVLANGTIVTASDTENADLARALRGGGNNCEYSNPEPLAKLDTRKCPW